MFGVVEILVTASARRRVRRAGCVVALAAALGAAGCGQKGPLFLPTDAAAADRATLPETLAPSTAVAHPAQAASAATPPTGTASPVRQP